MNIGRFLKAAVKVGKVAAPYLPTLLAMFGEVKKATKKTPPGA